MTRLTMSSRSAGLDSAIITVSATRVWSVMRFSPDGVSSRLLLSRK